MSVTNELIRKILELPEPRRRDVLHFVDEIRQESCQPAENSPRLYGMCSDIRSDMTFEEFQQLRQEMWGHPEQEWNDDGSVG